MLFYKFNADRLFTGTEMLNHDHVLVTDDQGVVQQIIPAAEAGQDIERLQGILCPGFVNCHCHLELSHMKGLIPEKTGLVNFVFKVVTQRHFANEEVYAAIEKAEQEMIANGIVAVGDICNHIFTLAQKEKQQLHYHNFIEASGWLPAVAETRLRRATDLLEAFNKARLLSPGVSSIVPHAAYSVSNELWQSMAPFFAGGITSIHNQETIGEDAFFEKGTGDLLRMYQLMNIDNSFHKPTGKTSLQSYLPRLQSAACLLLVHNTYTSTPDIQFALDLAAKQNQQLYWCICLNANRYIEQNYPPVESLLKYGANIVIGTDSLASNWSLNILDELKAIQQTFAGIGLEELLGWATINGAKALNMHDRLGSFEKGKSPGVLLIKHTQNEQLTSTAAVQRLI